MLFIIKVKCKYPVLLKATLAAENIVTIRRLESIYQIINCSNFFVSKLILNKLGKVA